MICCRGRIKLDQSGRLTSYSTKLRSGETKTRSVSVPAQTLIDSTAATEIYGRTCALLGEIHGPIWSDEGPSPNVPQLLRHSASTSLAFLSMPASPSTGSLDALIGRETTSCCIQGELARSRSQTPSKFGAQTESNTPLSLD
jgi:hypothetical protein